MIGHPANLYRSQSWHFQPCAVAQSATVISWQAKRILMDASATLHLSLYGNSRHLHMPVPRTDFQVRPPLCNPVARTPTRALTGARSLPRCTFMSVVTLSYHRWSAQPWASVPSRGYKMFSRVSRLLRTRWLRSETSSCDIVPTCSRKSISSWSPVSLPRTPVHHEEDLSQNFHRPSGSFTCLRGTSTKSSPW